MSKIQTKNSHSKMEATGISKVKTHKATKKNIAFTTTLGGKKNAGKILWLLNYKYQDSDLEQFVY
jgi:hypothetical protein